MKPLKLTNQRTLGFFVFGIKSSNQRVQQVTEEKGSFARAFLRRSPGRIKTAPLLGLVTRDVRPPDVLSVGENAGLDGFVFARCGHVLTGFSKFPSPFG